MRAALSSFNVGQGMSLALDARMCRRAVAVLMLVLTLAARAGARQEEKLSPAEELEVARLAEQFNKSLEQDNLSALIEELYVKDFEERLRPNLNHYSYVASVKDEVAERASREDLRRFYAAVTNFCYASGFLYVIKSYQREQRGEKDEREPAISELLPPDIIAVLKTDPILAQMVAEAEDEERRRSPQTDVEQEAEERKERDNEIKSVEALRGFASTLEKASALIRAHLKTLTGARTLNEVVSEIERQRTEESAGDDDERTRPSVKILNTEFFGYPKGTRLITVKVLMFSLNLVEVEGKLKILGAYIID